MQKNINRETLWEWNKATQFVAKIPFREAKNNIICRRKTIKIVKLNGLFQRFLICGLETFLLPVMSLKRVFSTVF